MSTKQELIEQIDALNDQIMAMESDAFLTNQERFDLEERIDELEYELAELRGIVPPFPDEKYATHPEVYIRKFNELRHLK